MTKEDLAKAAKKAAKEGKSIMNKIVKLTVSSVPRLRDRRRRSRPGVNLVTKDKSAEQDFINDAKAYSAEP